MGSRKALVFLLAVTWFFASAGFVLAGNPKFAVFSDPHLYDSSLGTSGSAFEAYLAQDRKMIRESQAILDAAVESILGQDVDFVLVPGDLTKDGELLDHQQFAAVMRRFEDKGIKVLVVPGNHDINNPQAFSYEGDTALPVPNVSPAEFEEIYADMGYGEALFRDAHSLSYVTEPVPGVWVFGLDSCKYDNNTALGHSETSGAFKPETLQWILDMLEKARNRNKLPIAFFHHGATEHFTGQSQSFPEYVLDDWANVSKTLAENGLKLVFTGHYHANDITSRSWAQDDANAELTDVETGSLVTWPSPYRIVTLHGHNAATIRTQTIQSINYDTQDVPFPQYAAEYLREGLTGLAEAMLQAPPYNLSEADAKALAPIIAQAFMAHYAGVEKPSAETLAFIGQLLASGDQAKVMLGMSLQALWTDLPPHDSLANISLNPSIKLSLFGTHKTGLFDAGAAEIPAFDPGSKRAFVVNVADRAIDILNMEDPSKPSKIKSIDIAALAGSPNSVAAKNGLVAVAVQAENKQKRGKVVLFDTEGNKLREFVAGALPDMVTFSPDGKKILAANEGEPNDDYTIDPEGSVSVINLSRGISKAGVKTVTFTKFNEQAARLKQKGLRIFGPNATLAQDMEPEYIAVSPDSRTAWVTLQENNAIAELDLSLCEFTRIIPLKFKDHGRTGNGLDAGDKDGEINIRTYEKLFGMYQPDAIESFTFRNCTYLITANEGDTRDYAGFSEEARIGDLALDPVAFPNAAELQQDINLGRLTVTTTLGDSDGNGLYEELYAFGGRSFSIWKQMPRGLNLVFDSGQLLEEITAATFPDAFNSDNTENGSFDKRSDNKGPEPEGVAVGVIDGRTFAFIGLERISGVMVFDVTVPHRPVFVEYLNNRDFTAEAESAGDLGPEGLVFIPREESPTGQPLLMVANEISGTTTVYEVGPMMNR